MLLLSFFTIRQPDHSAGSGILRRLMFRFWQMRMLLKLETPPRRFIEAVPVL
jgi:hypothetical protein